MNSYIWLSYIQDVTLLLKTHKGAARLVAWPHSSNKAQFAVLLTTSGPWSKL